MFQPSLRSLWLGAAAVLAPVSAAAAVSGSLTQWQPLEVLFSGPSGLSETGGVNPFLDYRLQVAFESGGTTYNVPGFFDGVDASGNSIWKARFTPDRAGDWSYAADLRTGSDVAVNLAGNAGAAVPLTGASGAFGVAPRDASAPGFLSRGRLSYAGGHYLQTQGDQKYWLKSGADSPENLLGYAGFDNTPRFRHQYAAHRGDWDPGDPDWTNDAPNGSGVRDGRNLIGAMNYLSDVGVNSVYFLPMNIGGDGRDTSPYSGGIIWNGSTSNDNTRFDISKLAQWETAFAHAQAKGLNLHVVLNEAETANKQELDGTALGNERKLFYREMVARFGHHNALQWNLSEEYNRSRGTAGELSPDLVKSYAEYLSAVDPYDHPLTVHNGNYGDWPNGTSFPDQHADLPGDGRRAEWEPFMGDDRFDLTSFQNYQQRAIGDHVEYLRQRSAAAGRPLAVMIDEPESLTRIPVGPNDNTDPSGDTLAERFNTVRKEMTWDIYLSGGSMEWFVHNEDQSLEDFRVYEQVYRETAIARRFMEDHLPFWLMDPDDDLLRGEDTDYGGGEVFALAGETYAIYLPDASNDDNAQSADGSPELDLRTLAGVDFELRWFNPRSGEFVGDVVALEGGGWVALGVTPGGTGVSGLNDWVGLIQVVPEPASGLLTLGGLLLLARRRR